MASIKSYLAYKRDTKHLVCWMIQTSNAIIKSDTEGGKTTLPLNTTGQTTVSGMLSMCELIAKHLHSIPPTIPRLFQSVIDARSSVYAVFQSIVATNPDPELKKSNVSHKYFLDGLTKAFEALGGNASPSFQQTENKATHGADGSEEAVFTNKFASLGLSVREDDKAETGETSDEGEDRDLQGTTTPQMRQQKKSSGKGKKGKRGQKAKKKKTKSTVVKEHATEEIPLESYRIIEDHDGLITEYLMAVYALFKDWMSLRNHVQGLWRDVANGGLNGAVAGAVSNMAITMIKRTETTIFVDFPGHDSYETIMQTITRGDPEKSQSNFGLGLHRIDMKSNTTELVHETRLDVMEQFSIYAYRDLLDFIIDFQQNRSGKPTKRTLTEIRDWDPYLDLQRATKEQRIKWRRSYTINWLYDLVNVFSSIVVQRNTMRGEHHVYEKVDWSTHGPWNDHRRLFGLNEFAGVITSLAMQKPGVNVRQRIFPHHVFQLQCILDSLTVSRGWSLSSLRGHVLKPPATGFLPRRDVDLFLDRTNQKTGSGFLGGADILMQLFEKDAMIHGDPNRHRDRSELLKGFFEDFRDWLGESKYMGGLATIPPSRFSNSNSNGLWEFSPFLCGVGLMEGLELAYRVAMLIWDQITEPILLVHLHNMLVQKGYIAQPVGMYAALAEVFPSAFFADGKVPEKNFGQALFAQINDTGSRRAIFQRRALRRTVARSGTDIHGMLNLDANRFFKAKSNLLLYRDADWSPDRVLEADLSPTSALGILRLSQTREVIDPTTGRSSFEDTDLIQRARNLGMDDITLRRMSSSFLNNLRNSDTTGLSQSQLASLVPEGYTTAPASTLDSEAANASRNASKPSHRQENSDISDLDLLTLSQYDISSDVNGKLPLSGTNYIWVTVRCMILFMNIEEELRKVRNPLWVRAYETDLEWSRQKRVGLAYLALVEQDRECLTIMANEFQNPRAGLLQHTYWECMGEDECEMNGMKMNHDSEDVPDCVVM